MLPVHLDVLRIIILVVQAGIEWFSQSRLLQILGKLPTLKDRLDLGDESRDLRSKVGVGLIFSRPKVKIDFQLRRVRRMPWENGQSVRNPLVTVTVKDLTIARRTCSAPYIAAMLVVRESQLHEPTDLELDRAFGGNRHAFERLGILRGAGGPLSALEHAEVTEFQAVARSQFVDDLVQESLNDLLDHNLLACGLVGDSLDEFFLRDGLHIAPQLRRLGRNPLGLGYADDLLP